MRIFKKIIPKARILSVSVSKRSNNYMAIFSNGSRLQYQGTVPQMTELTVCFWFVKAGDDHPTFRYDKVNSSVRIDAFSNKEVLGFSIGLQNWR